MTGKFLRNSCAIILLTLFSTKYFQLSAQFKYYIQGGITNNFFVKYKFTQGYSTSSFNNIIQIRPELVVGTGYEFKTKNTVFLQFCFRQGIYQKGFTFSDPAKGLSKTALTYSFNYYGLSTGVERKFGSLKLGYAIDLGSLSINYIDGKSFSESSKPFESRYEFNSLGIIKSYLVVGNSLLVELPISKKRNIAAVAVLTHSLNQPFFWEERFFANKELVYDKNIKRNITNISLGLRKYLFTKR